MKVLSPTALREKMEIMGITKAELASEIGISAKAVIEWLGGRRTPSFEHLNAICEVLSCQMDDLLEED